MRITVFTPTFNRGYILDKLYESLRNQIFKNFEWLIVDDGSTDNTEELIKSFQANNNFFPIRYIRTQNGGKHRAINKGVGIADGDLFFIVDSDDFLPVDSLETIATIESAIMPEEKQLFAGVCGIKCYPSGNTVGTAFGDEYVDSTTIEMRKRGVFGDKAEVYYTKVLRDFPFPEFNDEKFCTESIVWDRISHAGYKLRYFNHRIYICDYLDDGLTRQGYALYADNPIQWGLSIKQDHEFGKISTYGKSLEIYKYYLLERDKLQIPKMAKNLQCSCACLRLFVCLHILIDEIRHLFGKKMIKQLLTHMAMVRPAQG